MSTITLELTDTSGNSIGRDESTVPNSTATSAINLDSDDTDYERIYIDRKRIFPKNRERIHPNRPYSFCRHYISLIKLVLNSIIPDIRSFKCWQSLILILFATFMVVFSVLDFNSFLQQKRSLLKWNNDLTDGVPLWQRIILCFSGVAAFTNVLNVVLVIRGKMSSYFWGIIAAILYGVYAFAYGYVGDAQLYVLFFLPMQFVGIYMWAKELDNESTTRVKSLSIIGWILVIILSAALAVMFFYEIPAFARLLTKKEYFFQHFLVPHILDATTNALSVVAQFLLIFCYWEQYLLWTCVNLMAIVMYSGLLQTKLDINLLLVWIMLAINSFVGLYTWFRRWKFPGDITPEDEPDLVVKI